MGRQRDNFRNELKMKRNLSFKVRGGKKSPGRQRGSMKTLRKEWDMKSRQLNYKNGQEMGSGNIRELSTFKSTRDFKSYFREGKNH